MKRSVVAVLAIVLVVAGCGKNQVGGDSSASNTGDKTASEKPKLTGKALERKALAELNDDLDIYVNTRKNVKDYAKAMTGSALEAITKQFDKDKKDGKIKIRDHKDRKIDALKVDPSGAGEARYTFTDASYYADFKTKKPITQPDNKPEEFILALREEDGRWKIAKMMLPIKAPHGPGGPQGTGNQGAGSGQ